MCAFSYATHRIPHRSEGANSSAFITDLNSRSRDSSKALRHDDYELNVLYGYFSELPLKQRIRFYFVNNH